MPLVVQMVHSPTPINRELSLYVFQTLLDTDSLRTEVIMGSNLEPTHGMILSLLQDPDHEVKIRALNCANSFIECFSPPSELTDPGPLLSLLNPVIQVIK